MKFNILFSLMMLSVFFSSASQAAGNVEAGKTKAQVCFSCHGMNGAGNVNPAWPALAGQHASYIAKQLADFKSGARFEPLMIAQVASLSKQDMANLGAFFASQKVKKGSSDESKAELGGKIYHGGNKATDVAACMACHGPTGEGNPAAKFPLLSGQNAPYVVKALNDFRSGKRKNDPNSMMRGVTARMTDKEIKSVAEFVSGLH
ncbi:Cytochrome c4 [hydrothermal vent metagenome]|uniref:Cytochrome c4 n=1 Tax=hydrothermal vent metagenome TaxID=652676 RepID=A0A3B1BDW8_9ZZZZ